MSGKTKNNRIRKNKNRKTRGKGGGLIGLSKKGSPQGSPVGLLSTQHSLPEYEKKEIERLAKIDAVAAKWQEYKLNRSDTPTKKQKKNHSTQGSPRL